MRRAKIVCTLGPSTSTEKAIGTLIDAGMDVARLNFSHGKQEENLERLQIVRKESQRRNRPVAVLQDLQGPKIRVGEIAGGTADLARGEKLIITTQHVIGDAGRVSCSYPPLPRDVARGDSILLDDGRLQLRVEKIQGDEVYTEVVTGGILRSHKGINLPGVALSAPSLSAKDKSDIEAGVKAHVDFIAVSFVRSADDVVEARALATTGPAAIPILAKIERPEAVARLDEIIEAADGLLIARGDLGVELGPEKVPLIQKSAIRKANARGKLVITATQMLESMMDQPRPTRAEASDVANAVLDGTDALMLSGETAAGKYPLESVRTMDTIIREIESSPQYRALFEDPRVDLPVSANAIAHAAVVAARQLGVTTLAVFTESGGAARLMSEYRPQACIAALTGDPSTQRRLAAYWGVSPLLVGSAATSDEMFEHAETALKDSGLARPGDTVIATMGTPFGSGEPSNLLKIHKIR